MSYVKMCFIFLFLGDVVSLHCSLESKYISLSSQVFCLFTSMYVFSCLMHVTYTLCVIIYKCRLYIILLNVYEFNRKMLCSKYQVSARMNWTNLDLNKKQGPRRSYRTPKTKMSQNR